MDRGLRDWLALALIFMLLGAVSYWFARRTYRLTTFAAIVIGGFAITGYGLNLGTRPASYLDALRGGGNELTREMFGHLMPDRLRGSLVPGLAGWIALLVLTGGLLVAFDTLCAHRQQPGVQVGDVPEQPPGPPAAPGQVSAVRSGLTARRILTEELKFRLPAVEVRAPASMPGGSALESLAAVVSDSGLQAGKVTGALMMAVHALEARPRIYQVNTFVEYCGADGQLSPDGLYLLITVDLRDTRSGQSLAARVLRPCLPEDAAEMVAGFTARQVFRQDVSTPDWAVGSLDGEDLSAYLLTREMRPAARTFADLYDCRQRQRAKLEGAVGRSANSGLVQYELASIYDLDGLSLDSLLLHLDNRLHHPRFLRGRYRLAMSLSMLADPVAFRGWIGAGPPADPADAGSYPASVKADIIRKLRWAGMLRALSTQDCERAGLAEPQVTELGGRRAARVSRERALVDLLSTPHPDGGQAVRARLVLLLLARREFASYRRQFRAVSLLWCALRYRPERSASLALLSTSPRWWRHPRRRLWAAVAGREIVDARLRRLEAGPPEADRELAAAQSRIRRKLRLGRLLDGGRPWHFGKVPWQAVYNAACLYALPASGGSPGSASDAVRLLRLAISDPACELDRPSEWISADPDLRLLRGQQAFDEFVREQARRDFSPAADNSVAGQWLASLLPAATVPPRHPAPAVTAAADGRPPATWGWLRQLVRSRHPVP